MWGKFIEIARGLFDLRQQVKGHDRKLDDFGQFSREMTAGFNKLSERVLKLELQLEFQKEQHALELARLKEQQATERENFRLQLENLVLRLQRGLPPGEPKAPSDEDQ